MRNLPESDWKAFKKIREELLEKLCARINREAVNIVTDKDFSEHEKYLKLFKYIKDSDKIVAVCFNDFRRSTLIITLMALRNHNLLTDKHLEKFSDETQHSIKELARII